MAGKGDKRRPGSHVAFSDGWERIWGKTETDELGEFAIGRPCENCGCEMPADWPYALCEQCGDALIAEDIDRAMVESDLNYDASRKA